MISSTFDKSSNKKSGSHAESFWRDQVPVATAMVRAPKALPQAMSCPVSPITSICAASKSWPCFSCARAREFTELIAIVMIVGEGAKLEEIPEAVMLQLQLGTAFDVPGQQGKNAIRFSIHAGEDLGDAGQNFSVRRRKHLGKKTDVFIEKCLNVLPRRIDVVFLQNAGGDSGIGAAGDFDIMQIILNSVTLLDHELERAHARAAGADERSVDVEKKKALLHYRLRLQIVGASADLNLKSDF